MYFTSGSDRAFEQLMQGKCDCPKSKETSRL